MSLTYRISDLANTTPGQWAGHGTRSRIWFRAAEAGIEAARRDIRTGEHTPCPYQRGRSVSVAYSAWRAAYRLYMDAGEMITERFAMAPETPSRSGKQGARRDEDRMQASALVDWREQARGRSSRIADDGSVIYVAAPSITPEDQAWAARHVAMLTRATRGAGRMQ